MKTLASQPVTLGHWVQAARFKFLPQGIMPVLIAGAVAYSEGSFNASNFLIAFMAAAAVQVGLTMFNDTLDFVYGTDCHKTGAKNPFSGGSGVLASGLIRPRQAMSAIVALYFFALLCAIYLTIDMGMTVFWIALLGAFISIFYSAKPFRFAYHGFGELMMLIGYGPVITTWAFFVHAGELTLDIFLVGIIPGLLMWTMILINEIPDYKEDRAAGKKNIVYRLGPAGTKNLFIASLVAVYVYIGVLLAVGVLPALCALAFLGIPLAVVAARVASRNYQDSLKVVKANMCTVLVYSVTTATVAVGFLV